MSISGPSQMLANPSNYCPVAWLVTPNDAAILSSQIFQSTLALSRLHAPYGGHNGDRPTDVCAA